MKTPKPKKTSNPERFDFELFDFKPSNLEEAALDEAQPESSREEPMAIRIKQTKRVPWVVKGGLLLAVSAVAFFTLLAYSNHNPQPAVGVSNGFCGGFDTMCSSITTENPPETLVKLAAALPQTETKRYRVNVSVVPFDEK